MKILQFIFLLFLLISSTNAQHIPYDFKIGNNSLMKSDDITPVSNTIEKILVIDNTIWLATSLGLSKSTDNGETWINYYQKEPFGEESVSAVGYNNGVVWAATWHNEK